MKGYLSYRMNMKILLMGFAKLKYMPYIHFYLDQIDCEKNDVHILYWNRDSCREALLNKNISYHEFNKLQSDQCKKYGKIINFIRYRKYAKKIIRDNKFDFIITLHTFPGFLISDILKKYYQGKYIFDYRDETYEKFKFFKNRIIEMAKNSYVTYVSSDGFRKNFPKELNYKIITSHNLLLDSIKHSEDREKNKNCSNIIRIAFWGFLREENINLQIINKISQDHRFELHFYGKEDLVAYRLKEYVCEKKIENVFFHGEYIPEDRYKFILNTDLIHNIYSNPRMVNAMPNKYYDGIVFRIPQLVMENTFVAQQVEAAGVGLVCNPNKEDFVSQLYKYYMEIREENFINNCVAELDRILEEYEMGKGKLAEIFES